MTHHDTGPVDQCPRCVEDDLRARAADLLVRCRGRSGETDFIPTVADSVAPRQPLPPATRSSNIYKYSPYLYHSYRQWEMGSCDRISYNPSI